MGLFPDVLGDTDEGLSAALVEDTQATGMGKRGGKVKQSTEIKTRVHLETSTNTPVATQGQQICGVGGKADEGPAVTLIQQQSDYLKGLSGPCNVGAGPQVCSRISCSDNAAVWLCNDNADAIGPQCSSLASYVDDIANDCQEERHHGHITARGQVFDTDNFNVIVGFDPDC